MEDVVLGAGKLDGKGVYAARDFQAAAARITKLISSVQNSIRKRISIISVRRLDLLITETGLYAQTTRPLNLTPATIFYRLSRLILNFVIRYLRYMQNQSAASRKSTLRIKTKPL